MRNFYFLSNLCKSILGSRGNEPGYDCRFTVVRPSFDRRSTLLKLVSVLAILLTLGVGEMWGKTIASWGCVSISANTDVTATGGDANNNGVAKFQSTKAMTSSGTYCYYGSSAGGAVITFSNLNLSGYGGVKISFYTRASQQGNMLIQSKTSTGSWTNVNSPGPSISKSEALKTSDTISRAAVNIKLTHSKSSGSLYFGTVTIFAPDIACATSSLSGFSYTERSGPSASQTFTVSGSDLTSNISVSASSDYEVSTSSGSGYGSSVTLTRSSGSVSNTTIYVRLKSGLSAGTHNGTITMSSAPAINKTITLSGSVDAAASTYTIYVPDTEGGCSSIGSYTSDEGIEGSGTGTWDGFKTYSGITAGTTVTITASAESGYVFDGWTDGGVSIIMDDQADEITPSTTTSTTATFDMPTSDVYIMDCAFSSACDYQVALTKGTGSNGTFSLSSSNGSYDNCDANFVVTVSSIAPSSGYGCTGVTATGGNSSVTGPDGSGNYTVTYTKGNSITSTVTANFAAKVATPTFTVAGGTYNATKSVELECETDGATIYYTTDGTTPTTSSSVYSSAISVTTTNTTIKAIAAKSSMANSDVASATYVIQCATPVISPVTGTYTGAQSVTITCATDGASIYYTNNGGTPSSSSTSYSAFSLDATKTIKAIAIKSGWTDSEIATSTITVQYGITWKVNGEAWTPKTTTGKGTDGSSLVNSGTQWSALTLPTDPDPDEDGCGQKFIGWITSTISGELDKTDDAAKIAALDILNSGNQSGKTSETITTGTTFHAVFADYAE